MNSCYTWNSLLGHRSQPPSLKNRIMPIGLAFKLQRVLLNSESSGFHLEMLFPLPWRAEVERKAWLSRVGQKWQQQSSMGPALRWSQHELGEQAVRHPSGKGAGVIKAQTRQSLSTAFCCMSVWQRAPRLGVSVGGKTWAEKHFLRQGTEEERNQAAIRTRIS